MSHPRGVYVITTALVRRIKLIRQSRCRVRHRDLRHRATDTQEGLLDSTGRDVRAGKIPHIIDSQYNRRRRVGHDVIREAGMLEEKPLESSSRIEIIAAHTPP